jgi:hypothetical protein
MDSNLHPEPQQFRPERYLDKPLSAAEYINSNNAYDRDHFTYGAGRRVCPGVHVAEKSLYINMVRVMWGFNISKKKAVGGGFVEPSLGMIRGFLSVPNPFECEIAPRSKQHTKIIKQTMEQAEKEGLRF